MGLDSQQAVRSGSPPADAYSDSSSSQELQDALQALVAVQEKYRDIFDNATEGMYQTRPEGTYLSANLALAQILGYSSPAELISAVSDIENQLYVDPGRRRDLMQRMVSEGRVVHFESRVYRRDGSIIWVSENCRCVRNHQREVLYYEGTCTDITDQRASSEALRESEERYALALRGANDGIFDWNLKTGEIYFSERWKQMLGCQADQVRADPREWFSRVHPDDLAAVQSAITSHWDGTTGHFELEHRMQHADGGWRWMLSRGIAIRHPNGKATRMAGSITDITQRKEAEEQLLREALHDALTGMPNRALFMDRLERAVARGKRDSAARCAVLFLDMDRFKVVNDSLGHQAGDQLLIDFAHRLSACLRPGDTVARLGGDEFTVLLEEVRSDAEATQVADRMLEALKKEFRVCDRDMFVTASIGIALSTAGNVIRPQDLLRDADTAMYRAKAAGRNRHQLFDEAMHQRAVKLLDTEHDLRRAVEREEFELHYQPIVEIESGRIKAFEALVRWRRRDGTLVMPCEFISVAEETGLITTIGKWVLNQACRQTALWQTEMREEGKSSDAGPIAVAVNLSAKQFAQKDLCEQIQDALKNAGLPAESLILEITESVVMDNAEQAAAVLRRMKSLGVHVNIDDFGTGYSSLAYLQKFPVDTMKIDRSFIARLDGSTENTEIVRTIVTLAHNLSMTVTAEGVETEAQLNHLAQMSCENSQGYLLSRPLTAIAAGRLLRQPAQLPRPKMRIPA